MIEEVIGQLLLERIVDDIETRHGLKWIIEGNAGDCGRIRQLFNGQARTNKNAGTDQEEARDVSPRS